MAILENLRFRPCVDERDPDDYRPRSSWAAAADPAGTGGVRGLCALIDVLAPGDKVPLHTHPVDELILLQSGNAEVALGDEVRTVGPGTFIFVPAETPHGARNPGYEPATFVGIFGSTRFGVRYLERNPAPGTERSPAQQPFEVDLRAEMQAAG